jgi:hypothetical protein
VSSSTAAAAAGGVEGFGGTVCSCCCLGSWMHVCWTGKHASAKGGSCIA